MSLLEALALAALVVVLAALNLAIVIVKGARSTQQKRPETIIQAPEHGQKEDNET